MSNPSHFWPSPPEPSAGAEAILAWLHTLEFEFSNTLAWPWHRWRDCDGTTRSTFKTIAEKTLKGAGLLDAARALRLPETASAQNTAAPDTNVMKQTPHRAFEACMHAFAETRFSDVEAIATKLLQQLPSQERWLFDGQKHHQVRAYSMLLEMWWFAVYRKGMPGYVKAPASLIERLETGVKRWAQHWPEGIIPSTESLLAANHLAMRGEIGATLQHYKAAVEALDFQSPVMPQARVLFDLSEAKNDDAEWYAQHSKTTHHIPADHAARHAILVSCDQAYLHTYGALFVQLVAQQNAGDLVHFHLVNCTPDDTQLLANISQETGVTINHSFEENRLVRTAPFRVADITSTARYIYLPDYLSHYASVTVSDLDGWQKASGTAMQAFDGNDLLISSWIWRKNTGYWRLPWSNVSAGLLSVRATGGGKQFANHVSRYIQHAIRMSEDQGTTSYFADQAALFLTLRHMQTSGSIRFGYLGAGFQQSGDNSFYARHGSKRTAMEAQLSKN